MKNENWVVEKNRVRTDYPIIENLKQFLADLPPILPKYHPEYIRYWSIQTKRCIEGIWRNEFGKWRYMPGNLYFFGNFSILEDTQIIKGVKKTKFFKPRVVDFIWEYSYQSWVAYGFSGFEKDDVYSCNLKLELYREGKIDYADLPESCISTNGDIKKYKHPFEYISQLHDEKKGLPFFENECLDTLTLGSRGGGKALLHGSKVQTPFGEVNIEDIKVGDKVFGQDGKCTNVVNVSPQGKKNIYEVIFRSGRKIKCCADHLWEVRSWDNKTLRAKRTEDILKDFKKDRYDKRYDKHSLEYKYRIRTNKAVEYETKNFKIDPYLIGSLLGDGHINYNKTNYQYIVSLTTHQSDLQNYINTIQLPEDVSYRIHNKTGTNNYAIHFTHGYNGKNARKKGVHIYDELERLNIAGKQSHDKFIPKEYLFGDINQRYRLLQGLMDTDGYACKKEITNAIKFTFVSKQLATDVVWLCRSLGIACSDIHFKDNEYDGCYTVEMFSEDENIFTLKRKKELITKRISNRQRSRVDWDYIIDVKDLDCQDYATCISVDNKDKLFLTDNFVVTHNSYWVALGELEYNYIFCGARRYDDDFKRGMLSSRQLVGSADKTKSSELLDKFKASQDSKIDNKNPEYKKWFGIYTESFIDNKGITREVITPCPFYKRSLGTLAPNNKDNMFRSSYKINSNGEFKEKGTGCEIGHVNYSAKKAEGFTAGVGGRHLFSNVEEVGLNKNYIDIKGANDAGTKRNGVKIGVQHGQGTSGFIDYIQDAKKIMLNPEDYGILNYSNVFSHSGTNNKIAYFLSNIVIHFDCKDENGNTDFDKVIKKINQKRIDKAKSTDPQVLRDFLMNEPVYLEEMWLTDKGYYMPYEEVLIREAELLKGGHYKTLMNCVELYWDDNEPTKVGYKILHEADPYIDFPHDNAKTRDPSGCVVIYKFPANNEPNDYYLFSHDPYIEEDINKGGSVGVTHVFTNPKYISEGLEGNTIVATYIGKPIKGLDFYNENLEKLLQMYNNPERGLWYEKNRGEVVRSHFIAKGKTNLLSITPQFTKGSSIFQKNLLSYGFLVGNRESKLQMIKNTHDFLLEETSFVVNGETETKRNVFRIPCLYTIRQLKQYNLEGNFDAVSSLLGGVLGLKEINAIHKSFNLKQKQKEKFKQIISNKRIFT